MTMTASIYGRLVKDAKSLVTKTAKPMAVLRVPVDVTPKDAEQQQSLFVDVLAFGDMAERVSRHGKGGMIAAVGRMTRSMYQAKDGNEHENWSLLADAVHSSRTVRPGGRKPHRVRWTKGMRCPSMTVSTSDKAVLKRGLSE